MHMDNSWRQFGVDLFLVSGYTRNIKLLPSSTNQIIFGYVHCPCVARFILEQNIKESEFVDYVYLHRAILDQVASDFLKFALKEDGETLKMFSKVMENCGAAMIQSAKNIREPSPLWSPTFDFLVSILTFLNQDFENDHKINAQFFKDAEGLLLPLIVLTPKPKELMNEGELTRDKESNKTTEKLHQLLVMMASTPILGVMVGSIITKRAHDAMTMIRICESYKSSSLMMLEDMRKLAWATGVVAESLGSEIRDDLVKTMSGHCSDLIEPKFRKQVDLRCDSAFMLHKCGLVERDAFNKYVRRYGRKRMARFRDMLSQIKRTFAFDFSRKPRISYIVG